MGYAARGTAQRWAWLHRQPAWRRIYLAVKWFRPAHRRIMFRGQFWRWLRGYGCVPQWLVVKADHLLIRAAQQDACEAERRVMVAKRMR